MSDDVEAPPKRPRRARQRVVLPDGGGPDGTGTVRTIAKEPRADVLYYNPRSGQAGGGWTTILVRRTHDEQLARRLAEKRWAEIGEIAPLPFCRKGWWSTVPARRGVTPPAGSAIDQHDRVVTACEWTARNASPGIEFRPATPQEAARWR